jgi:hypothetical protein
MNINTLSINAINELKRFDNKEIKKDEINSWLVLYHLLFISFESYPESYKDQLFFYNCYTNLFDLYKVSDQEEETAKALQELKKVNVDDEMQLLKWLVDYEYLNINFISLAGNTITEESIANKRGQIMRGLDVFFKMQIIQNCVDFDTVFNNYYIPMIRKYNAVSKVDSEEITPFDDNYDEITSLKHHLKEKGMFF